MNPRSSDSPLSSSTSSDPKLVCPEEIHFPFQPYPIQISFMRDLFFTIENRKIGLFESPTGTGKSMSIICGALTWLKEHQQGIALQLQNILKEEKDLLEKSSKGAKGDWLSEAYESSKLKDLLRSRRLKTEKEVQRELQWKKRRELLSQQRKAKAKHTDEITNALSAINTVLNQAKTGILPDLPDADLLPEEYQSTDEPAGKLQNESSQNSDLEHVTKIYYATRTHSQVTQFIKELKRSPYGQNTRVTALASRQNLCVFDPVKNLRSLRMINDRCIELQKGKAAKKPSTTEKKRVKRDPNAEKSCPYYEKDVVENLSNNILDEVQDIEELTKSGISSLGCPYYASRLAVPDAEVVAVPYNLILHRSTREASGISLKGQVVIIDEAHNFLEAIAGMYSSEITEGQIKKALWQLQQYHGRYKTRFTANNLVWIKQLLFVLGHLENVWKTIFKDESASSKKSALYNSDQFLLICGLEMVNLLDLLAYCQKSFLARKLMAFAERYPNDGQVSEANPNRSHSDGNSASPFMFIEGFLETLTNAPKDGRIIVSSDDPGNGKLKFLLLNPAIYVSDILYDARSVIFAGGTMQPMSDYDDQLFSMSGIPPSRVHKFSCGHIIAPDRILPLALQKGPAGNTFQFNYQNRDSEEMILQFGRMLQNLCNIIPAGIVCFFPSYEYESKVFQILSRKTDLMTSIERKKKVFREPKNSSEVDSVLKSYSASISNPSDGRTGAVILAVVGGKLSEGINFSDDLGRCVIMVGLPYANRSSLELQEKMSFLNSKLTKSSNGRLPGQLHYENLCMKAVNQSIGRAIRHKNDYAVILLVDLRYGNADISRNLPQWIGNQLKVCGEFSQAFTAIKQFFASKTASTARAVL